MNKYKPLYSEEDIRTKIVTVWLADHGFGPSDISIEYSFEIRLGRKVLSINSEMPKKTSSQVFRPRADILVRNYNGKNLLVVEVKAPNEPLDDDAREQGICYARLLRNGGIAPFVILTNGHETKIYDSISEELINGTAVPLDHPHIKAGFRVSVDDIALRAEALETFISLSPENLTEFCRQQVAYRMRLLKDEDPYSGKKYIPSLYIERREAKKNLVKLLDEEKRRVVVVVGPPQVGKTNFICYTVEERLEQGLPCLFYPAIGMGRGLLESICEDFEWILGDASSSYNVIHSKLQRILSRTGQNLTIFIDGWNEANANLARTIDHESERLSHYNISCVISMTNVAAGRLLRDEAGNPSHVAEAAGIHASAIPLLEISPEQQKGNWSKVFVGKYNSHEREEAYRKYGEIFNVKVPSRHQAVEDPLLLRVGMETYREQTLPDTLDGPILLEQSITKKAERAGDLKDMCVRILLPELADEMFSKDAPLRQDIAMKRWGLPSGNEPPKGLFEAALLAKVCDEQGFPSLDFYYSRERDFAVACWVRNWSNKFLERQKTIVSELTIAAQTQVGIGALRWFLQQPKYEEQLRIVAEYFPLYESPSVKRTLLSSLYEVVRQDNTKQNDWMEKIMYEGLHDVNSLVKVEAAKLMIALDEDAKYLIDVLEDHKKPTDSLKELLTSLLATEEDYPLEQESVGSIVLDAIRKLHRTRSLDVIRKLHWEFGLDNEESEITDILVYSIQKNSSFIRIGAAKALGYISPQMLLRKVASQIKAHKVDEMMKMDYRIGIEIAVGKLQEMYYGSMCPGYLEVLKDNEEQLFEEYMKMNKICIPVISLYQSEKFSQDLSTLLGSLQPRHSFLNGEEIPDAKEVIAQRNALRYQLPLPFDLIVEKDGRD